MNKFAAFATIAWWLSVSAQANEESFNEAVNLYLKGYADCRDANALRAEDLASARQHFNAYQTTLDRAAAIDPSILKASERDMDANLKFCERVNINLKMAEAAPTLEKGFEHCEKAKSALETQDIPTARNEMEQYTLQRDQAFAITESIMDVFTLASQVRACGRLQEKITSAEQASNAETVALSDAQQQLTAFKEHCNLALSFTRQSSFTVDTLDEANTKLADARQFKKLARANKTAYQVLKQTPDRAEAQTLKSLDEEGTRCEMEVTSHIRTMTKQRRNVENQLDEAIAALLQAKGQCKIARQRLAATPVNATSLKEATSAWQRMSPLIQTGNTPVLAGLAVRHTGWPQSKTWQKLKRQTTKCDQDINRRLTEEQEHLKAAPKAAPPPATVSSAPPVETAAEKITPATTSAVTVVDKSTEKPAQSINRSTGTTDLQAPSAPATPVSQDADWTDLADEEATEKNTEQQEKKQLRKSWTDLVQ